MQYDTPPSMPLKELRRAISRFERLFLSPTNSLSDFFNTHVKGAWDVDLLTATELRAIQENLSNTDSASLIVLEITLDPE